MNSTKPVGSSYAHVSSFTESIANKKESERNALSLSPGKSKDDLATPSAKPGAKPALDNDDYVLMRTVAVSPREELAKQANTNPKINTLGTPSTFIFLSGDPRFSTISSAQAPEVSQTKWGGKPNLIFSPTPAETNARQGLSIVLDQPATLHAFRSSDVVTEYGLTSGSPKSNLHERMEAKGKAIVESWDKNVIRDGVNKGMYGKYTELAAHEGVQGMMFYLQAKDFVDAVRNAIPQKGAQLRTHVVAQTKFDAKPELQNKIFESQQKYVKFLKSIASEGRSPKTVAAVNTFEQHLQENPGANKNYFDVIGKDCHASMRAELLDHYKTFTQEGFRCNEALGRLFPWEAKGIDIGHIDKLTDSRDVNKHFSYAKRFALAYDGARKEMAREFKAKGLEHPVIKEFMDAKNAMLKEKGELPLSDGEKSAMLKKILHKMQVPLSTYSYQYGQLEKADLPSDIRWATKSKSKDLLTREKFISISNRLRDTFNRQPGVSENAGSLKLKPLPPVQPLTGEIGIIDNEKLLQTARKAVESFLASNVDFELYTSNLKVNNTKEDSGALLLRILKEKNPAMSDRELVANNLDKFSLDNCMTVISSVQASSSEAKVKYEAVQPKSLASEYQSLAYLGYSKSTLHNYAAATEDNLSAPRPLQDTKAAGYQVKFDCLEGNVKENMAQAWEQRALDGSVFKDRIAGFIQHAENQYELPVREILSTDNIESVWNHLLLLQEQTFGSKHKFELSDGLFQALGGDWSRSKNTQDETVLRQEYDAKDWHINPHGSEYRQHRVGKGNLVALAPSKFAVAMAAGEIEKGRNPFKSLKDMNHVLEKLKGNQADRFALHAIFMNEEVLSGPSSSTLRMLNYWEQEVLPKLSDADKKQAPSMSEMVALNEAYCAGGKYHHTAFEVQSVARNRNVVSH